MKERFNRFMIGRYGMDELGKFLNYASIAVIFICAIFLPKATAFGLALIIINYFRVFSKNINARSNENSMYLRKRNKLLGWFSSQKKRFDQRKTHRFYKCPSCKKTIRVPKGKGKIEITCPVCNGSFIKKS